MNVGRWIACCLFMGAVCFSGTDLYAQGSTGGKKSSKGQPWQYNPANATLSPYLNLTNPDIGPLPNYFSLARPQLQQQDINKRQMLVSQEQESQIADLDKSFGIHSSEIKSTGTGAGFMNFDHFYPSAGGSSASRGSSARKGFKPKARH